ncbi:unnamed protein product [Ranitomeya imitator]|uniref:Protein-cysteine N-palmitoyltransferase HHAT-like protein n=1 Tax=Ranitomeya imitator TaxID=111125 RepID=A0ABN9M830_9NEOB|nr:unnamed protein product [Ranitomeya imitator]
MRSIRVQAVVHVLIILLVDVFFHFLYILSIPSDLKMVKKLSDWSLVIKYLHVKVGHSITPRSDLPGSRTGVLQLGLRLGEGSRDVWRYKTPSPDWTTSTHRSPPSVSPCYMSSLKRIFDRGINDWALQTGDGSPQGRKKQESEKVKKSESAMCTFQYVYDYLGENHDNIKKELVATIATFIVTTLWLGPCEIVYIWSVCNCFGLNFELWVQKFFELEPFASIEAKLPESMSRRIRGFFGAANFWAIILYNILALNSLDFALLVAKRILITGFPVSTLSILFVTYCGVQLIKERERVLALEEERNEKLKAA